MGEYTVSMNREALGKEVRRVWLEWAHAQPNPKESWLLSWEELDDDQKEADRLIGERLYHLGRNAATHSYARALYR